LLRLKFFGKVSFIIAQLKLASCRYNQDSSHTCKETNETGKIEDPADKSNSERISDAEDLQDGENNGEAERKKVIHGTDYCTYQLTRTSSSPDCHDSKEASSKLSSLNSGMFVSERSERFLISYTRDNKYISQGKIKSHCLISVSNKLLLVRIRFIAIERNSVYRRK